MTSKDILKRIHKQNPTDFIHFPSYCTLSLIPKVLVSSDRERSRFHMLTTGLYRISTRASLICLLWKLTERRPACSLPCRNLLSHCALRGVKISWPLPFICCTILNADMVSPLSVSAHWSLWLLQMSRLPNSITR